MSTVAVDMRQFQRTSSQTVATGPAVQSNSRPLRIASILLQAVAILLLLFLNKAGLVGVAAFFTVLALMFIVSPEMAMRAFVLGYIGLVVNTAFVPKHPVWTVARFGLMSAALGRFSLDLMQMRQSLLTKPYYLALLIFVLVATLTSVAGGYYVRVSLLKLFSFAVGTSAVFAGVLVLHLRKADLSEWFVAVILSICVLGFLSMALGVAYNAKDPLGINRAFLFNGAFYHPNTSGPFCALMTVYLACCFLLTNYRNRWLLVLLGCCLVYFLFKSQSRTAAGVLVIGLTSLGALYFSRRGTGTLRIRKRLSRFALAGIVVLGLAAITGYDLLTGGRFTRQVVSYINKSATATDEVSTERLLSSRRSLIERSWLLFLESPVIGHGFEVDKSEAFQRGAGLFSAPVEKGFLPTAVLEEVGLLGTIPFIIFVVSLGVFLYKTLNIPGLAMWCTFLAINLGEVMIFSPGGHGGLGWILVGAGMLLGDQSVIRLSSPPQRRPVCAT